VKEANDETGGNKRYENNVIHFRDACLFNRTL
jgi:hypothetical protein